MIHQSNIFHVLLGDGRDWNVEDVDILAFDQVQQQIERTLEGFEKHEQRIRWNIQILRYHRQGFALHQREGHL